MLNMYDEVVIKKDGVDGVIVDVFSTDDDTFFTVESNTMTEDKCGTLYPLFYCKEEELEKV